MGGAPLRPGSARTGSTGATDGPCRSDRGCTPSLEGDAVSPSILEAGITRRELDHSTGAKTPRRAVKTVTIKWCMGSGILNEPGRLPTRRVSCGGSTSVDFDDTGGPRLKCRARPMSKVCRRSAWKVIDVVVVNLRAGRPMVRTKV